MNPYLSRDKIAAVAAVATLGAVVLFMSRWEAGTDAALTKTLPVIVGSAAPADPGFFANAVLTNTTLSPSQRDAERAAKREAKAARLRGKAEKAQAAAKRYWQIAAKIEAGSRS